MWLCGACSPYRFQNSRRNLRFLGRCWQKGILGESLVAFIMSDSTADPATARSALSGSSTEHGSTGEPAKAMTVSETLEYVQQGLGVHTSASRSILLHICQRLARLEENVNEVRDDVYQLRCDANQGSETVRGEVSGVRARVNNMSSKLKEYENVIEVFQNDMRTHQNHLSVLSTKVKKEKELIKVVDTVR
jgi:hypothetical protein